MKQRVHEAPPILIMTVPPSNSQLKMAQADPVRTVLGRFSLTERDLNKTTDNVVFLSLGLNFSYSLGIHLGLSESDITAIKRDNDSDQDRVVALFLKWRKRKGSDATYLSLMKVLIEYKNQEAAEKLCQYYQDKHQTSSTKSSQ